MMEESNLAVFREDQIEAYKQAFNCFKKACMEFLEGLTKAYKRFNIDENYLHNVHMAKYSKKKRVRKKYTKKLIR